MQPRPGGDLPLWGWGGLGSLTSSSAWDTLRLVHADRPFLERRSMLASMFVSPAALVIFSLCDMSPEHYNVRKERFILAPGFEGFCPALTPGRGPRASEWFREIRGTVSGGAAPGLPSFMIEMVVVPGLLGG